MTQDIAEHLRKLTSRNGRYWLRESRNAVSNIAESTDELPFRSVAAKQSGVVERSIAHESIVVTIPDVSMTKASTKVAATNVAQKKQSAVPAPHTAATKTAVATKTPLAKVVPKVAKMSDAGASLVSKTPVKVAVKSAMPTNGSKKLVNELVQSVAQASKTLELPKKPMSTKVGRVPKQKAADDAVKAARANQSREDKDSIAKIADEIIAQFPVASPSVIMFSGSQAALQTDETSARVAAELASRNLGRVLLVDSDFNGRRLTKASGMASQGGLSEVINIAYSWEKAILKSGSSVLDFMPVGNCSHKRWTPMASLREAVAEIRSNYQFVCVSAGDAHDSASGTWAEIADGAFLVISATSSSDAVAESASEQLRQNRARLVGCIVADVESDAK